MGQKRVSVSTDVFKPYFPVGEAVATLLHPFAEVVLHDLRTGRIVHIWNCCTDRQAGDLSHLARPQDLFSDDQPILGPYEKALTSQGRTKSITAGLRDVDEKLIGFLCINIDVTLIDGAAGMLRSFASSDMKRPEPIYRNDMKQHISYLVRDYSLRVNRPVDRLTREQRSELVSLIDRDGLFQARNSVMLVATAMKISRASVYNLILSGNKHRKAKPQPPPSGEGAAIGRSIRNTGK